MILEVVTRFKNNPKMEFSIRNLPDTFEEPELFCPKCGSEDVMLSVNSYGYFEVSICHKCNFKNPVKI